jgi:hypothetical protein
MEQALWDLASKAQIEMVQNKKIPAEIDLMALQELVTARESWRSQVAQILEHKVDFSIWEVLIDQNFPVTEGKSIPLLVAQFPCTPELLVNAAQQGAAGVVSAIDAFDVFQIQYLVELARDLRMGFFPLVKNRQEFEELLQTDCPTVVVGDFFEKSNTQIVAEVKRNIKTMPKSVCGFCATMSDFSHEEKLILKNCGIRGSFVLNF